ncbi:MAG: hypothetical protein ABSB99_10375 [Acidimicrobiales bacterium]
MTTGWHRHLTWGRVAVAVSAGLIVFGIVDAALPHYPRSSMVGASSSSGGHGATSIASGGVTTQNTAAGHVAKEFVAATDTTGPEDPEGDVSIEAALAPQLAFGHSVSWPAAWTAQQRSTTVVLDAPGPALSVGSGQVTVIVTGTMTVTSDTAPPTSVPISERVILRHVPESPVLRDRPPGGWVVTGVEAQS